MDEIKMAPRADAGQDPKERTRTTWGELLAGAKVGERFRPLDADALRREQK